VVESGAGEVTEVPSGDRDDYFLGPPPADDDW
ncbi:uncharacterized protein METZ01_LOCUS222122, partial [marine metagenome]